MLQKEIVYLNPYVAILQEGGLFRIETQKGMWPGSYTSLRGARSAAYKYRVNYIKKGVKEQLRKYSQCV